MNGLAFGPAEQTRARAGKAVVASCAMLLLVVLSLSLAGCTLEMGLDTKVNPDGSGTIGVRLSADKELQDALAMAAATGLGDLGGLLEGIREDVPSDVGMLFLMILGNIPTEWTVDRGTDDDGAAWLSATRSFESLEELERLAREGPLSSFIDPAQYALFQDEGFFATKTAFSTIGSLSELAATSSEGGQSIPLELLERVLRVENRVTLPGAIRDNNADEIDGNTLTWEVVASSTREMYAGSVIYRWGRIIGIAVAAFVALALLVTLLTLLLLRRRRRGAEAGAPRDTKLPPAGPAAG
ncbi:MAG: hypothetical protein JXA87_16160 [Thermoleophilia bacterium]|nr:hypothetical protein [Thermoleophilia bacterium]